MHMVSDKSRHKGGFFFKALLLLMLILLPFHAFAADEDPLSEAGRFAVIDLLMQNAIKDRLISGGVVLIGDHQGILYEHSVGTSSFLSGDGQLQSRIVFDVASLTKVFATTPAIVKLMDQGKLSLLDPISRWFPEFPNCDVTILNLLTHTSGFSDFQLSRNAPMKGAIERVALQINKVPPGSRFLYADINFILLGELVRRASGKPLDMFLEESFYKPLRMHNTGFNPPVNGNSAGTLGRKRIMQSGVVQDENARILGGVAGHAGLFSTAHDLSRFSIMLLNNGRYGRTELLSSRAVEQMTAPYFFSGGRIVRGLGWDRESRFSSPKGALFSELSYGHTGYSGTSVWIDPDSDLFVILLTTRLDYKNVRNFSRLRSSISTIAAALFAGRERRPGL